MLEVEKHDIIQDISNIITKTKKLITPKMNTSGKHSHHIWKK